MTYPIRVLAIHRFHREPVVALADVRVGGIEIHGIRIVVEEGRAWALSPVLDLQAGPALMGLAPDINDAVLQAWEAA